MVNMVITRMRINKMILEDEYAKMIKKCGGASRTVIIWNRMEKLYGRSMNLSEVLDILLKMEESEKDED